jgi:hypothetical protein
LFYVATAVKNGNNLEGRVFRPVDDQVRVHREELHIRQILAPVSGTEVCRQKNDLVPNYRLNAVRDFNAALFRNVAPDLDQVERRFRRKNVPLCHSGLAFSFAR